MKQKKLNLNLKKSKTNQTKNKIQNKTEKSIAIYFFLKKFQNSDYVILKQTIIK